jgi:hypothetical protein
MPRRRSSQASTPRTGSANAHRPSAVALGDAPASCITTAELEMQAAPATAAATGRPPGELMDATPAVMTK